MDKNVLNLDDIEWDNEEVLMLDRDTIPNKDDVRVMAPGQGKKPIPWNEFPYIDELDFPTMYGGFSLNYDKI